MLTVFSSLRLLLEKEVELCHRFTPQRGMCLGRLKRPKHEKSFVAGMFTQIGPVRIGELEIRPKTPNNKWLGPILSFLSAKFLFRSKSTKWRFSSLNFGFFVLVPKSRTLTGLT